MTDNHYTDQEFKNMTGIQHAIDSAEEQNSRRWTRND